METKPRFSFKSLASPEEKHFDNLTSPLFSGDFCNVSVHVHTSTFLFETAIFKKSLCFVFHHHNKDSEMLSNANL